MNSPEASRPIDIAAHVLNAPAHQLRAERIKGGLTNESWCVYPTTAPDNAVVVRLSIADEHALQLDRHSEARVLKWVEQAGIGAPVLWCSPEQRVLVTRKLDAPTPDAGALRQPEFIAAVATLLRRLHTLEALPEVQQIDLQHVLQGYWRSLEQAGAVIAAADCKRAEYIALESAKIAERCLCHNDVHHLNLLGAANRLWLLDWEYAGMGDPLFDLASVCVYHGFDAELRHELLRAYRGEVQQTEVQRLERMCWLFDYIRQLWSRVRELSW